MTQDIRDFFHQYAIDNFGHENYDDISFAEKDIHAMIDTSPKIKFPFLLLSNNSNGTDRPSEKYIFGGGAIPDTYMYSVSLLIADQQEVLNNNESYIATVNRIDAIIKKLIGTIFENKMRGDRCLWENLNDEINIAGPGVVGARKAVYKIVTMTFNQYI